MRSAALHRRTRDSAITAAVTRLVSTWWIGHVDQVVVGGRVMNVLPVVDDLVEPAIWRIGRPICERAENAGLTNEVGLVVRCSGSVSSATACFTHCIPVRETGG